MSLFFHDNVCVRKNGDNLTYFQISNQPTLNSEQWSDGENVWWVNHEELHRTDGPAVEGSGKFKSWWRFGVRHRVDGPAIEYQDGETEWFLNGKPHRDFGLPSIEPRPEWFFGGHQVDKRGAFDAAITQRKKRFGLFVLIINLVEDDLFVLIKLNWK